VTPPPDTNEFDAICRKILGRLTDDTEDTELILDRTETLGCRARTLGRETKRANPGALLGPGASPAPEEIRAQRGCTQGPAGWASAGQELHERGVIPGAWTILRAGIEEEPKIRQLDSEEDTVWSPALAWAQEAAPVQAKNPGAEAGKREGSIGKTGEAAPQTAYKYISCRGWPTWKSTRRRLTNGKQRRSRKQQAQLYTLILARDWHDYSPHRRGHIPDNSLISLGSGVTTNTPNICDTPEATLIMDVDQKMDDI
jgi:hypothetical protein